ncbi:MAG TPA: hypothetical protein VLD38_02420 [Nitrosopumilaceae archaeon]|nr:hypothetical protein [Nitrosopumilaceae archaeon]
MKKIIYAVAIIVVAIVSVATAIGLSLEPNSKKDVNYHVTLADPKLYTNEIFNDTFTIQKGTYQFSFVPNGDSPETLSISLNGPTFSFAEDFQLNGILHDTGISVYYTWQYIGKKEIQVPEDQQLKIVIDPHGNLLGSVSVDLIKT